MSNAWWGFVQANKHKVQHIKDRKERFKVLSEMWQDQKATIVTVHSHYLLDLHTTNANLRKDIETLVQENIRLKEVIEFMKQDMA